MPRPFAFLCVLTLTLFASACSLTPADTPKPTIFEQAGAVVKVVTARGHGSGVHIGGGYILTAGHVSKSMKSVKVDTQNSLKQVPAEVLWSNHGNGSYDVSLLYSEKLAEVLPSVDVACGPTHWGQEIIIIGNPKGMEFITTWGRVSGFSEGEMLEQWRNLIALDATATHGVSGGPVMDAETGELVGLLVGGYPGTGYAFMVPTATACHLMARVA